MYLVGPRRDGLRPWDRLPRHQRWWSRMMNEGCGVQWSLHYVVELNSQSLLRGKVLQDMHTSPSVQLEIAKIRVEAYILEFRVTEHHDNRDVLYLYVRKPQLWNAIRQLARFWTLILCERPIAIIHKLRAYVPPHYTPRSHAERGQDELALCAHVFTTTHMTQISHC